ncbi:MAG: tetratricopeptide repeat protein [Chloroflexi bacterium]|nr:tetratricopeptide repeat protein [Chloroflexota bacterium]
MPRAPRVGRKCANCGYALRPSHRFCPNCGTPAAANVSGPSLQVATDPLVDLSENRRLVTILFADLAGSTQLGEQLDPEDLRQFLASYFAAASRQIQRFGGTIDKYIGDAIMAVFGAPVAHEDDAERAINAALAFQAAFAELNDELTRKHAVASALRIGINTGEVVAGLLSGGLAGAYTVVGDTVNTAQRFEAAAPPGGILVSESTWKLSRRGFEFEWIPPLTLRGKSEPQVAFRVVRRLVTELDATPTPLVGRAAELAHLRNAMDTAASGHGRLLHVVGEAGVGKSRLLREFRATVDPRVVHVVARCASFEVETPYALAARLLRGVLQVAAGAPEQLVRGTIQQLLERTQTSADARETELLLDVLGYGERATFDPESKRRVVLALMRRFLVRDTAQEPTMVVAEDLHWADAASSGLLAELSRDIPASYSLVITTSRPGWQTPWAAENVDLEALPEEGARSLVELAFGQPVDEELAQTVLARTGGNPFFIEEVVRGLVEGQEVRDTGGVLALATDRAVRLPATIQEVLAAHLDRLAPSEKRVLQPAAVCGRTFAEEVVERIAANGSIVSNLVTLEQERLIVPQPVLQRTYLFRHALIQEVAYQTQLQSQRRQFHGAIGEALEVLYPDRLDELIGELAFHYGRSDHTPKALQWLVRAGDRARGLFANQEALRYYTSALERAQDGDGPQDAGTILERIGDIQHLVGRYDDAIISFRSAQRRVGSPASSIQARLERKVGTALRIKGAYSEATAAFQTALDRLGQALDIESAHIRLQVGQLYWRTGRYKEAQDALSRAVGTATKLGRNDVLAEGLKQLGNIPLHSGDPKEAVTYFRRSQHLYEQLEDLAGIAAVRMNLGAVYGRMGLWDDCLAELEASLKLHERIGDVWHIGVDYNNIGEAHRSRGDYHNAIAAFERAHRLYIDIQDAACIALALTGLGMARVEAGDLEHGRDDLLEAEAQFSSLGRSMYLPDIYRFLASADLALGQLESASHYADKSIEFARAANARHQEAMTQRVLGEIALARGDAQSAQNLLEASRQTLADVGEAGELARTEAVLSRLKV